MILKAIIALAVVAGIGGGAWYWSEQKAPAGTASEMQEGASVSTEANASGTATFGELAARGGSSECQVRATHEAVTSSGTVYVANGKVRADFTAKAAGMSITGHVIQADGYAYSWSDLMPQGVKVRVDEAPAAAASQGLDSSTKVEYSCVEWMTDESKFAVPSSVTFTEFNAEANGAAPMPR
jgi:hypothetical protein